MDIAKSFSRRSFITIFFIFAIIMFLVDASFYLGVDFIFSKITISAKTGSGAVFLPDLVQKITHMDQMLRMYFIPASLSVFLFMGLVLWISLKSFVKNSLMASPSKAADSPKRNADQIAAEKRKRDLLDHKLFLHLLSVLQREGRLLDFFSENLDLYEDAQIGAAVRNIHENCKKTLDKYMQLQPVMQQNEGDNVTIEPGFDPNAVKLTGNVTGNPPFKGVLRHRGWKVTGLELPKLSATGDGQTLSPAEVEIQ